MANPHTTKRDIAKAKSERAADKRARRQRLGGPGATHGDRDSAETVPSLPNDQLLRDLDQVHARFLAEEISFEEFELTKDALLGLLATD